MLPCHFPRPLRQDFEVPYTLVLCRQTREFAPHQALSVPHGSWLAEAGRILSRGKGSSVTLLIVRYKPGSHRVVVTGAESRRGSSPNILCPCFLPHRLSLSLASMRLFKHLRHGLAFGRSPASPCLCLPNPVIPERQSRGRHEQYPMYGVCMYEYEYNTSEVLRVDEPPNQGTAASGILTGASMTGSIPASACPCMPRPRLPSGGDSLLPTPRPRLPSGGDSLLPTLVPSSGKCGSRRRSSCRAGAESLPCLPRLPLSSAPFLEVFKNIGCPAHCLALFIGLVRVPIVRDSVRSLDPICIEVASSRLPLRPPIALIAAPGTHNSRSRASVGRPCFLVSVQAACQLL